MVFVHIWTNCKTTSKTMSLETCTTSQEEILEELNSQINTVPNKVARE